MLSALKNPKVGISGMAAALLAQHRYLPAIPALNLALQKELDPVGRLNFTGALDALGQPSGLSALKTLCDDSELPSDLRLGAAERSFVHGGGTCSTAVTAMLATSNNLVIQSAALYYLLDSRLPASAIDGDSASLKKGVHGALDSGEPDVREMSAKCIGRFKIFSERSHLLTAMQAEYDPKAELAMQKSLNALTSHQ